LAETCSKHCVPTRRTAFSSIRLQTLKDFGAYGIRTRDLLNAIEALYQLS
jgi:hypothetical protein